MKLNLLLIVFILTSSLFAQNSDTVMVGNMYFQPNQLTIEVGDQVTFILVNGTHNVNFEINSLFFEPFNNPAQIESLPMQSEPGLMGVITFDVPGLYNFDCSNYFHASMGMYGQITVIDDSDCIDDDQSMNTIFFAGASITSCTEAIDYLMQNYSWTSAQSCSWEVGSMFGGMSLADFCECSCTNDNLTISEINFSNHFDDYLYSIDLLGRKLEKPEKNQIIFDIYLSGKVVQRFVLD
tara:strand:+ start:86 stop:799 length:714 start_codon:yes stop_codon:yes gene_type:complete